MSSRFFENKHSARITAVCLKKGQRGGFGLKIALAKGKERMIRKNGEEERRTFFFLKAMVVLLVVVLSTLDSFCQKKKMLDGRGEQNSARFISLLEVKRGSRTEAKRW